MLIADRETILAAVRQLPQDEQRHLAQEILDNVPPTAYEEHKPKAKTQRPLPPAPSFEQGDAMALRGLIRVDLPIDIYVVASPASEEGKD